ncbi:MAG: 50S ribosomal protein L20 [Chlamydiia bacterium]|nr:50S ribosomal protein L20 [Chlamydiia bacterium]
MARVTNAVARRKRRKKLFKRAKGYWGDRKNHVRLTRDAVMRAMAYSYRDRRKKKSQFRSLWIQRIGVAAKLNGISYSKFMHGLKVAGCELNRKMLADMAVRDPAGFSAVATRAKDALVTA